VRRRRGRRDEEEERGGGILFWNGTQLKTEMGVMSDWRQK
jgi:hypothetical protein